LLLVVSLLNDPSTSLIYPLSLHDALPISVGHLVLFVLEAASPSRVALSDSVCTGLQLVEHWQDVAEDLARGRVYLPQEDLERFGCTREDLTAPRPGQGFRRLMALEVGRARSLLDRGAPLARHPG